MDDISKTKKPKPVGGFGAIRKNLVYPEAARKEGLEGKVDLALYLDEKGRILKSRIVKSIGPATQVVP